MHILHFLHQTDKKMITDLEKIEIFENTPFFYTSIQFYELNLKGALGNNFETVKDFKKMLFSENTRTFFRMAITIKNSEEFIKYIDNEFELFNIYNAPTTELKIKWLQITYNYIVNKNDLSGFINKPTVVAFVKWYNITLKDLQPQQPKAVISDEDKPKIELHSQIFKDNAFEFWQRLFENLNIII